MEWFSPVCVGGGGRGGLWHQWCEGPPEPPSENLQVLKQVSDVV